MSEVRLLLADSHYREINIKLDDLISYKSNGSGTYIWVRDESMFNGKRFYILAISIDGFNMLLNDANVMANYN